MQIDVIQKDSRYNDVIITTTHKEFDSVEELLGATKPKFHIECSIVVSGQKTHYERVIDCKCIAIGDTIEECYKAIFIRDNSWKYCNDINIVIDSKEQQDGFYQHFYGNKEGIGNYAKCGGDMW